MVNVPRPLTWPTRERLHATVCAHQTVAFVVHAVRVSSTVKTSSRVRDSYDDRWTQELIDRCSTCVEANTRAATGEIGCREDEECSAECAICVDCLSKI